MNQIYQRGWLPGGFRILIGGAVIWGVLSGMYQRSQADDKNSHRGSGSSQRLKAGAGVSADKSRISSPATQPSGFHPEFSRRSQRDLSGSVGNSSPSTATGGHVRSRVESFGSNSSATAGPSNVQPSMQSMALMQKDRKEKPKPEHKPEHKPDPKPEHKPAPMPKQEQPKLEKPIQVKPHQGSGESKNQGNDPNRGTPRRNDNDSGKGRVELRKPSLDKSSGSDAGLDAVKSGKIKLRQPNDKTVDGIPKLDAGKLDTAKLNGRTLDKGKPNVGKLDAGKLAADSQNKPPRLKDGQTLSREHLRQVKQDLDLQQTKLRDGKPIERVKLHVTPEMKQLNAAHIDRLPRAQMKLPVAKNGKLDPNVIARLKIRPAHETFQERIKTGDLNRFAKLKVGNKFQMQRQFGLHHSGDVARRMSLLPALAARGGWRHRHFELISPLYARHCRPMWYAGPSFCSPYLWYPNWSPWVDWCWWDTCSPIYDPRPIFCRPVHYHPCAPWVVWQYPVWQPLPYVSCGSWVDVDPVIINNGVDLQLLATRFVDPGHPTQELGPRFRVWFRNNSPFALNQPFNVMLIASPEANASSGLPEAGVRIPSMAAGEIQSVDIRLPYAANFLNRDLEGRQIPFSHLNVIVDSHNELPEAFEENNGATLVRGDILPVDPVIFAADPARVEPSGITHLAGEGFGPEPGKAVVVIGDQEFDVEILGWFDLGVQIRIPNFDLTEATAADLVIIRGDGAASPPLTIEIDPSAVDSTVELPSPEAVTPEFPTPPPLPE